MLNKGVIIAIALASLAAGYFVAQSSRPQVPVIDDSVIFVYPQTRSLADVSLTDMNGQSITPADFKGDWWVLYFGFTFCPDACPMALANMKQIKTRLPENTNIKFGLISVDPQRDTPERLKEYVTFFHPDFYAATSDVDAIDALTASVNVVYAISGDQSKDDYSVDHSNFMVLLNPEGQHAGIISSPHDPEKIAAELTKLAAS